MESRTLGDYRLIQSLAESPEQTTWLAEQVSIQRPVILVELIDLSYREAFLADVRAKASVDHPLIGSVYEAVSEENQCYVVMERISGHSLSERLKVGEPMRPADLAHVLRRTAEAMLQLAAKRVATGPLDLSTIHFDPHGVIRIENLVRAGEPNPDRARADIYHLGQALVPLVADSLPGASRVLTVLAWMRREGTERELNWNDIRSYGEQIEAQLLESMPRPADSLRTARMVRPKSHLPLILCVILGLAVIGAIAFFVMTKRAPEIPAALPSLPESVKVEAGIYPTPDGGTTKQPAFEISAHEVTIGEYREFLNVLERLDPAERDVFDLEDQPATKSGHEPDDWAAMLEAAVKGDVWQGRPINLFCPIVNIDWWDASAYSNWKGCRLPTQEEWFAALRAKAERPEFLQPASWGPVTEMAITDRTPNGLRGMAGSVAEWTRRPSLNPANPLGSKLTVIIGASYLKPNNGAFAREWTGDRLTRRPDLGFRVVFSSN